MLRDKFEIIKKYVKGKDVLDCGCVGSNESGAHTSKFLHQKIVENSRSVLGIDTNALGVEQLKDMGYNVIYANVETIDIGKKFDVIVAGDLIEHISNLGLFLGNVKKHLRKGGLLIIHTPNPFGITRFYHMLIKGYVEVNPDHMCYYDIITLKQALERHGYKIIESHYVNALTPPLHKKLVINFFTRLREGFSDSILVVAKPEVFE